MKTFIEQKIEIRERISELERENERLERQIIANEDQVIHLKCKLEMIGLPSNEK